METEGIEMLYGNNIKSLDEEDYYKYLSILQVNNIKHTEVKMKFETLNLLEKIALRQLIFRQFKSFDTQYEKWTEWIKAELKACTRKPKK